MLVSKDYNLGAGGRLYLKVLWMQIVATPFYI
jgi:hypothetical protein